VAKKYFRKTRFAYRLTKFTAKSTLNAGYLAGKAIDKFSKPKRTTKTTWVVLAIFVWILLAGVYRFCFG
jgi:hypothetical protein